jgi:hypothetical protein
MDALVATPHSPAGIRVLDQCGSARRYVMVQVKPYDREAGWTLPVPASTPVRSLVVLCACAGAVPDGSSLPVLDLDELRDRRHDRSASAGSLALEGTCQARPG